MAYARLKSLIALNKISVGLRMIRYSNHIALLMSLITLVVCSIENMIPYVILLVIAIANLSWFTVEYAKKDLHPCPWGARRMRYDCQVTTLQHRISLLSNIVTIVAGSFFMLYITICNLSQACQWISLDQYALWALIKFTVMYITVDKIFSTKLTIALLDQHSHTMSNLIIPLAPDKPVRYPEIYLDDVKLSTSRYRVSYDGENLGVIFSPSLSLGYDSVITYCMRDVDETHVVNDGIICDTNDRTQCFLDCRTVVKEINCEDNNLC